MEFATLAAALISLAVQQAESRRAERKADDRRSEARAEAAKQRTMKRQQLISKIKESRATPSTLTFQDEPDEDRTSLRSLRIGDESAPPATVSTPGQSGLSI